MRRFLLLALLVPLSAKAEMLVIGQDYEKVVALCGTRPDADQLMDAIKVGRSAAMAVIADPASTCSVGQYSFHVREEVTSVEAQGFRFVLYGVNPPDTTENAAFVVVGVKETES